MEVTTTITQFNRLIESGTIESINRAADAMGISSPRLSSFLSGKYKGNVKKTQEIVQSFVDLVKERGLYQQSEIEFVPEIENTKMILNIVRLTHVQRTIGIITGRSGFGKTMALQNYAAEHKDVIYIEVDSSYSPKVLMQEIHQACGYNGTGHLNKMKKEIVNKLNGTGRLLVIDQAEYLSDKSLDLLRTIHDKAKIGLLIAGLPKLMENVKGIGGIHEQIYTRIGAALELNPLKNEDMIKLINTYIPGTKHYKEIIEKVRRNARVLWILTREAKRIAEGRGTEITTEIIDIAHRQLVVA